MKLLHFADAHIDMANYGRHDPQSGLPLRVLDFLKSLDTIIETAIAEKVDLVIFAGDAYKDRTPAPTFQREWGKRIMRLSQAKIPTILLVGNHDVSPSVGRAHAIEEFQTLQVPYIHVISKLRFLGPNELGIPIQILGVPWLSRSAFFADFEYDGDEKLKDVYENIQERLADKIDDWLAVVDVSLPVILTAHASIEGAKLGSERTVMLGADLMLSGSFVKNPKFDYVAMGHIHKPQNLNGPGPDPKDKTAYNHPPVIYPGSIERVDFGEAKDDKFFVLVEVEKGQETKVEWRKLKGIRKFIECYARLKSAEGVTAQLKRALPKPEKMADAIVKLSIEYPRDYEKLIDENELRAYASQAFEFHLVKRPQTKLRVRLAEDQNIASLTPLELLETYWEAEHTSDPEEVEALQKLAAEVLGGDDQQPA